MREYVYKGFKINYMVSLSKAHPSVYQAKGEVICFVDGEGPSLTQKFQTTASSEKKAEQEITKMINEYIDFEWDQYLEMKGKV